MGFLTIDLPIWFYLLFYTGPLLTIIWIAVIVVWLVRKYIWNRFEIVRKVG